MTTEEIRDFLLDDFPLLDGILDGDWIHIIQDGKIIVKFKTDYSEAHPMDESSRKMLRVMIQDAVLYYGKK